MARGISLHIGLNSIDPDHYGSKWALCGCEPDARSMYELAESRRFSPEILLTQQATTDAVTAAIADAAEEMEPGDIFLLTYSGHGANVADISGDEYEGGRRTEEDRYDETWCLYNRMLIDDELYQLWGQFPEGARILVLSDSCHSGTVMRGMLAQAYALLSSGISVEGESSMLASINPGQMHSRGMPRGYALDIYRKHKDMYDSIQKSAAAGADQPVYASILLISACQDNQTAEEYDCRGLFTSYLLQVWDEGGFSGNYRAFHREIQSRFDAYQSPNYICSGAPNPAFESQKPFTIETPVRMESRLLSSIG